MSTTTFKVQIVGLGTVTPAKEPVAQSPEPPARPTTKTEDASDGAQSAL